MKRKVFEYIESHPYSSVNDVAESLNLPGLEVQKAIRELKKESYLKLHSPVPLSPDTKCSNYYSATGKPFPKDENNS